MHTSLVRLQNVFGFFTTVAFTVAALVAVSSLLSPQTPSANIEVRNLQVVTGRPHYRSNKKLEYANIRFDLDADFTSLFNWNTKQLFVYVLATYPPTSKSPSSTPPAQSIIWDTIIPSTSQLHPLSPWTLLHIGDPYAGSASATPKKSSKSSQASVKKSAANSPNQQAPGNITLRNVKPKYQITDLSGFMAGRDNVTLEVGWNVQPWVGALTWTTPAGGKGLSPWWSGVRGGRSKKFRLPDLKGKKTGKTVMEEGAKASPRAAEAKPVLLA